MQTPRLEEVGLTSFKSFTDQRLPLQNLTLLIGRNGSGKSNALDALTVLSRLSLGEPVRDALDGPRHGGEEPIRGGAEGCAPLGRDAFAIGCRVRVGEAVFDFDVEIEVRPTVRRRPRIRSSARGVRFPARLARVKAPMAHCSGCSVECRCCAPPAGRTGSESHSTRRPNCLPGQRWDGRTGIFREASAGFRPGTRWVFCPRPAVHGPANPWLGNPSGDLRRGNATRPTAWVGAGPAVPRSSTQRVPERYERQD